MKIELFLYFSCNAFLRLILLFYSIKIFLNQFLELFVKAFFVGFEKQIIRVIEKCFMVKK
ncbi:hypothetical protein FIM39_05815 [Helicobacter pylori]|nr:hypothetical protein FIM39_05815 [Helicobacter pylori]